MTQRFNMRDGTRFMHLDKALDVMEDELTRLSPWDGRSRETLPQAWLGMPSVRFCQQVLEALEWFPEVLPGTLDVGDVKRIMEAELETIERMTRRRDRLRKLSAQADDAVHAVGGDLMDTTMEVYSLLARAGRARGISAVPDSRQDNARHDPD